MDASLIFGSSNTSNALSLGAPEPGTGVNTDLSRTMTGQEFAGVMRDLMASSERQGIAATVAETGPTVAETAPTVATLGLLTLNLGDQISLITTASPLPDAGSLAEFARSQGLGENAVKALFGDLVNKSTEQESGSKSASNLTWRSLPEIKNSLDPMLFSPGGLVISPSDLQQSDVNKPEPNPLLENNTTRAVDVNLEGSPIDHRFPNGSTLTWLTSHPNLLTANSPGQQVRQSGWENAPRQILNLSTLDSEKPLDAFNDRFFIKTDDQSSQTLDDLSKTTQDSVAAKISDIHHLLLKNQAVGSVEAFENFSVNQLAYPRIASDSNLMSSANNSAFLTDTTMISSAQSKMTPDGLILTGKLLGGLSATAMSPTTEVVPAQPSSESPVEMGPIDAMRIRLVPAWETMTRQLAKLKGNDAATPWANLTAASIKTDSSAQVTPQAILDLGETDIGLDLQSDLNIVMNSSTVDSSTTTLNPSQPESSRTALSLKGPDVNNSPSVQTSEDRSGQIQQLADKLGQAMSERLQDQIDKGQWRMHLKLNPGHLGSIDVELDMHSGGLDALFKTDNTLTRELITQGISKLREGLTQSGMAVASVWVNSDSQRESGGNSTPRQNNFAKSKAGDKSPELSAVALTHKEVRSADGWDTLA